MNKGNQKQNKTMIRRITKWGFQYFKLEKDGFLTQIGAQIGHIGPDFPSAADLLLLRRINKH